MKDLKTTLGLRKNVDMFSNAKNAFGWAEKCVKMHIVVLGNDEKYWVVCFADAQKLVKMGYEIALNIN